jgi:uncharacterized protein (DUF433 family)
MITQAKDMLGVGMYTPREAAFYARIPTQRLTRWVFGDGHGDAVIEKQVADSEEKIVTFLDFVQSLAIRAIRLRNKGIPLQTIRRAYDDAVQEYGIEYPFARPHQIFLLADTKRLIIKIGADDYRELAGKARGNKMMSQIVEPFLTDLTFSDGLAVEYTAWSEPDGGKITMNPQHRFGEPTVIGCGYTARALWEANEVEGSVAAAAEAYGVEQKQVLMACKYYDHLVGTTAA